MLGYYKDKNNRERPMYNITKVGALQLAARYDAIVRYNLIQRVMELSKNETNSTENRNEFLKRSSLFCSSKIRDIDGSYYFIFGVFSKITKRS